MKIKDEQRKVYISLIKVSEMIEENINNCKFLGFDGEAEFYKSYLQIIEDPAFSDAIDEKLDECGSAPKAVLDAAEANAQIFEAMEDEVFRGRAVDIRKVGKMIAKYIMVHF